MAAEPSPAEPALAEMVDPTIAGTAPDGDEDQSLDESIADDDSFDAYGEDANGEAQNNAPGADNDDYARIFDSPAQGEVEEAEQDVSKAGESMNSSSASDTLPHQSSVAPITGDISSSSLSHGDGALANPAPANPADTASLPQPASAPLPDATLDSAPSQPIHAQAEASSPEDVEAKPNDSEPKNEDAEMEDDATAVDIQKLVDDITAASAAASSTQPPAEAPSSLQDQDPQSSPMSVNQTLLPPRPALTQEPSNPAAIPSDNLQPGPNVPPFSPTGAPVQATGPISQPSPYPLAAAPADERRYMSEAKWERFPEGSRIFIGNLSQERVSKKDVFDLFHKYGRLAQISLKSAYGFVQYHNVTDAQGAMENLQGAEIRGRKIQIRAAGQEMTIAPVVRHRPVEKIVVGEMKLMVGMPMLEHTNPMIMAVAGRGRLNVLADLDQMRAIAVDPRVHMVDHAKILNDWIFPDVMVKKSLTSSCCLCKKSSEISLTGFNVHSMIAG
ncbi:putative rna-binding protein [Phaeoacremonium minimum UCRPA7]|uniref:Putative rna-binding protein n=1 Tax=Phaeoacremonium minimum (strain UCR-PA7) TaxID=1286976 RepID=R8BFC9_PHAM7|nr:putative rna-binding protein [Phaeoacremonium minimum UCRPA7]EON98005.1 putative rna-binding protein [Phaeoacremonium minimum UCRPA7]